MTDCQLLKLEGGQLFLHALKRRPRTPDVGSTFRQEWMEQRGKVAPNLPQGTKTIAVTNHLEENPVLIATKTQG